MKKNILILLLLGVFLISILPNIQSATWNSSYTSGLVSYYYFNNKSDILHNVEWNIFGSPVFATTLGCKSGSCLNTSSGNGLVTNQTTNIFNMGNSTSKTLNFWADWATGDYAFAYADWYINHASGPDRWYIGCGGLGYVGSIVGMDMITLTRNSSGTFAFVNGVQFEGTGTCTNTLTLANLGSSAGNASGATFVFDDMGVWNRSLSNYEISELYNAGTGIFYNNESAGGANTTTVKVELKSPLNNTQILVDTSFFSSNYTGVTNWRNFTNTTLYLWYSNGSLFNTNYSANNDDLNSSNRSFSGIPTNTFLWNYQVCGTNTTLGKPCFWADLGNWTFSRLAFTENDFDFNTTSYETKRESFILNVSSNFTLSSAILVYNGTSYTSTIAGSMLLNYSVINTFDIPLINIKENNNTFYWVLNFNSFTQNSNTYGQNVSRTYLINCNSTYYTPYINYSFRDEVTSAVINASIPTSSFTYWIQGSSGAVNRTYTFINNSENWAYAFCFYPNSSSINMLDSIQYKQEDYPQRIASSFRTGLSNSILNKVLYLLSSTDGIFVTFQVINGNTEQPLNGVLVSGNRTIGSSVEQVAYGVTGADGAVTFWLNPDFSHTFLFVADGYDSYSTALFPTQSSYTISLGGTTTEVINDYTKGISYLINPKGDFINNNTLYGFNFTLSSSYWTIENFGIKVFWRNGTMIGEASSTSNGGIVNVNGNTYNQTGIKMDFFYVINSTYYNGTRTWYVENGGTKFSILNFFNDLSLYMSAGIFGIDNFGRIILSIFIIVITIGTLSSRYGIASEAAILGMLFGLVYFFDIGIGLIPPLTFGENSIPHFITILVGLITVSFIVKEEFG